MKLGTDTFGKEQRQHTEAMKARDQRHAAPEFDEYNRQDPRDRHVRTPPERQHVAERKRRDDTGDGHDNQQAAPVIRVDGLEPDIGAQNHMTPAATTGQPTTPTPRRSGHGTLQFATRQPADGMTKPDHAVMDSEP